MMDRELVERLLEAEREARKVPDVIERLRALEEKVDEILRRLSKCPKIG